MYREWDEEVWEPPEAKAEHAAVAARRATLKDTVGAALARRRDGYTILESAYGGAGTFAALLAGMLDELATHRPFNPESFHRIQYGQTVGGLRAVGSPDFWQPDHPVELRSQPCEGYVLAQTGELRLPVYRDGRWVWSQYTCPITPRSPGSRNGYKTPAATLPPCGWSLVSSGAC